MNNKGQYLLYDAIFALLLLFMIITTVMFVIENNNIEIENPNQYKIASNTLDVLENTPGNNNRYLLSEIAYELDHDNIDNNSLSKVNSILDLNDNMDAYTFSDMTTSEIILLDTRNQTSYKQEYSAFKTVDNHIFQLKYYKN